MSDTGASVTITPDGKVYSLGFDRASGPERSAVVFMRRDRDGRITILAELAGEDAEAFIPYIETFERARAEANRVPRAIDALAAKNPDKLHHEPGVLLVTPCKDSDPPELLECEIEIGGAVLSVYQLEVKFGDDWRRVWVFPRSSADLGRYNTDLAKEGRLRAVGGGEVADARPCTGAEFVAAAQAAITPRSDDEIREIIADLESR